MTLTIEVTGELEAALMAQAHEQGLTAERVACRVLVEALTPGGNRETGATELPILHLGAMGSLHRRDLYDDDQQWERTPTCQV